MQTLLLVLLFSTILAFIFVPKRKGISKRKVKVNANDKWRMPNVFWDEFNWLTLKIYNMKHDECEYVQHLINQFIYKYQEFADFHTFNDRVAILLHDYQRKVKSLLTNKHLEHGTSV